MRKTKPFLLLCLLSLAPAAYAAEANKCVDANGNITLTDVPCHTLPTRPPAPPAGQARPPETLQPPHMQPRPDPILPPPQQLQPPPPPPPLPPASPSTAPADPRTQPLQK